uniref:Uncharacterized protein n=1 Tax=Molossus molossus TaxID=27622 RepID=A0A7J8IAE1_MOLMO|nr:hypothetical protein HJG59_010726 [Molossus molossus]
MAVGAPTPGPVAQEGRPRSSRTDPGGGFMTGSSGGHLDKHTGNRRGLRLPRAMAGPRPWVTGVWSVAVSASVSSWGESSSQARGVPPKTGGVSSTVPPEWRVTLLSSRVPAAKRTDSGADSFSGVYQAPPFG